MRIVKGLFAGGRKRKENNSYLVHERHILNFPERRSRVQSIYNTDEMICKSLYSSALLIVSDVACRGIDHRCL